jgi:ATP-dependent Clp protease protease subunit
MSDPIVIPVVGVIDDEMAKVIIEKLYTCLLTKKNVHIPIYSPGGDGDQIFGAISLIREMEQHHLIVTTINVGYAFSAAAMLLIGGTVGHRYGLPGSDIMIHRGTWRIEVTGDTADTVFDYSARAKQKFEDFYTSINGDRKKILKWLRKDTYFTTDKALEEGLIDQVGSPSTNPRAVSQLGRSSKNSSKDS